MAKTTLSDTERAYLGTALAMLTRPDPVNGYPTRPVGAVHWVDEAGTWHLSEFHTFVDLERADGTTARAQIHGDWRRRCAPRRAPRAVGR